MSNTSAAVANDSSLPLTVRLIERGLPALPSPGGNSSHRTLPTCAPLRVFNWMHATPANIARHVESSPTVIAATSDWRERSMPGRRISAVMLTLAGLAVCCNQHCLQPWHWLFMLTMLFGTIIPKEDLLDVLRRLLPCIYVFAAVSVFFLLVLDPHFQDLLKILASFRKVATINWNCYIDSVYLYMI